MEWKHCGSPRPKKLRAQKSTGKVLTSLFLSNLLSRKGPDNWCDSVLKFTNIAIQGDSEISLEKKCGVSLTQNNSA
jgi:hypothetical protein